VLIFQNLTYEYYSVKCTQFSSVYPVSLLHLGPYPYETVTCKDPLKTNYLTKRLTGRINVILYIYIFKLCIRSGPIHAYTREFDGQKVREIYLQFSRAIR